VDSLAHRKRDEVFFYICLENCEWKNPQRSFVIFVSSARVTSDPSDEYFKNQSLATKSWRMVASAIVYFGPSQEYLESPITRFLPSEPFPKILDLVEFCAEQSDWSAILNSDIVLTSRLLTLEKSLKARKASCASSWRHQFDPAVGIDPCERVDNGLDFFAASPEFWKVVYQDCPETLRLGAQRWDSWMLAYFGMKGIAGFYDLTPSKCVRHPLHFGRIYGDAGPDVDFMGGWPTMSGAALS
jgi:hypothetical protein